MTDPGEFRHRFRFDRRQLDANGEATGPMLKGRTLATRLTLLRGSEPVMAQRLEGHQPAVLRLWASDYTRGIDNSWVAVELRAGVESGRVFEVTSAGEDETLRFVDVLAICKAGGTVG